MSLTHVTSSMTNAVSQGLNTTSNTTIEDRIETIMGNRITNLMDDTIDMIKNANTTVITNQSENGISSVTNVTDVNKVGVKSIDKLGKSTGKNTALDLGNNSSIDSPNASMSLEEMEKSPENATINKQGTTAFEGQNISSPSTVNTTENTSSDINQKIINNNTGTHTILDADNNKTLAAKTTNKQTSTKRCRKFLYSNRQSSQEILW